MNRQVFKLKQMKIKEEPRDDIAAYQPPQYDATTEDEVKPPRPFAGSLAPLQIRVAPLSVRQRKPATPPKPHNKPFTCDICLKGVGTKGGLKYHIQAHLNGRRFKCDKCTKSYATKNDLNTHLKRHLQQFTCDFCSVKFPAKDYVLSHISAHHLPKVLPCVDCCKPPKSFATNRALQQHYKVVCSAAQQSKFKFTCKLCGLHFITEKPYLEHCKLREQLRFTCTTCGEKFPCKLLRDEHVKQEKMEKLCKICNVCVSNLKRHHDNHHRLRKCEICKVFESAVWAMHKHQKKCGTEEQIRALGHQCRVCHRFFRSKVLLNLHLNAEHPNFWCDKCSGGFHLEKNLRWHIRSHKRYIKDHPYKCVSCEPPKYFIIKNSFNKHFNAIHAKPNPSVIASPKENFFCDICKLEKFTSKIRLANHIIDCRGQEKRKFRGQIRLVQSQINRKRIVSKVADTSAKIQKRNMKCSNNIY